MNEPIVPRAMIEAKARAAFVAGLPLESCPLPWNSAARATWAAEYARLASGGHIHCVKQPLAQAFPRLHDAFAYGRHLDLEQTA